MIRAHLRGAGKCLELLVLFQLRLQGCGDALYQRGFQWDCSVFDIGFCHKREISLVLAAAKESRIDCLNRCSATLLVNVVSGYISA